MTLSARLGRLTTGLTGEERAVLVLRALHAGEEPDPALRIISDPEQAAVFDRCMGYINAANSELQSITHNLVYHAHWLENLYVLDLLRESAVLAQEQTGETPDPKKAKNWRKAKAVNIPEYFLGVAEEMRVMILDLVLTLCQEFGAVEQVRTELAAEFESVDLVVPEVRAQIDDLHTRLARMLESLNGPKAFPQPEEEHVEQTRARLEHVFMYWRLIQVRQ